jgi:hypothetical protein
MENTTNPILMKIAIRPPYTQLDLDRLMATAQELTHSQYKR